MRLSAILIALFTSSTVYAQSPPASPDVTKLLQELIRKVDRLQGDVDRLKKDKPKSAATPTGAPATAAATQPPPATPQDRVGGGWAVGVYPWTSERQTPERVGRFIAPPGGFTFSDFRRTVSHPGWAFFKGEGLYNPAEAGRYVFSTRISWQSNRFHDSMRCATKITVDGQSILSNSFDGDIGLDVDRNTSGGIDLQPQVYNIAFEIRCDFLTYGNPNSENLMASSAELRAFYDKIRFTFGATGPSDMAVRAPTVRELLHDVSGKKSP